MSLEKFVLLSFVIFLLIKIVCTRYCWNPYPPTLRTIQLHTNLIQLFSMPKLIEIILF